MDRLQCGRLVFLLSSFGKSTEYDERNKRENVAETEQSSPERNSAGRETRLKLDNVVRNVIPSPSNELDVSSYLPSGRCEENSVKLGTRKKRAEENSVANRRRSSDQSLDNKKREQSRKFGRFAFESGSFHRRNRQRIEHS